MVSELSAQSLFDLFTAFVNTLLVIDFAVYKTPISNKQFAVACKQARMSGTQYRFGLLLRQQTTTSSIDVYHILGVWGDLQTISECSI